MLEFVIGKNGPSLYPTKQLTDMRGWKTYYPLKRDLFPKCLALVVNRNDHVLYPGRYELLVGAQAKHGILDLQ